MKAKLTAEKNAIEERIAAAHGKEKANLEQQYGERLAHLVGRLGEEVETPTKLEAPTKADKLPAKT